MRLRWWRRRKPEPVKHGPLDEWLTNPDIVAVRIARMTEQRFVADTILGPSAPVPGSVHVAVQATARLAQFA